MTRAAAWLRSLAGQFVCFMLAALILSQALAFLVSKQEHSRALDDAAKSEFFSRARTMTRLMETVPPDLRRASLQASETGNSRFWLTGSDPADPALWRQEAVRQFARPLENFIDLMRVFTGAPAEPALPDPDRVAVMNVEEGWHVPRQSLWALPQPVKYTYFEGTRGYGLVITLSDGQWLSAAYYLEDMPDAWTAASLVSPVLTALILALIGIVIAHRITRPLRGLARSAEALGRGESLPPLDENGPEEVRGTAAAFNRMQARLNRFIEDRTRMLAAIGHDLRTPLTALRLRTEFVSDPEEQRKMLEAIDEMHQMTEAAIELARGGSSEEPVREVDLMALVGSLCDDLADLGQPVSHEEGPREILRCRPNAMRRALRNLIENAVRYGGRAEVSVVRRGGLIEVVIRDSGPGIAEAMREHAFAPFSRLERSRNRDSGGAGLGLTIARSIVRQHGGDICLSDGNPGLTVTVTLPRGDGQGDPFPT